MPSCSLLGRIFVQQATDYETGKTSLILARPISESIQNHIDIIIDLAYTIPAKQNEFGQRRRQSRRDKEWRIDG